MNDNNNFVMQNLYSSMENLKILSGTITALEVEQDGKKKVDCAIIYYQNIKIIIPIHEMNIKQERKYLRNMLGAKIDFIVLEIDELRKCAVASRIKAMKIKQKIEFNKYIVGDIVEATVISVGIKHIKINCLGSDLNLRVDELNYGYIQDANEFYSVGDIIKVKVLEINKDALDLKVSVKALMKDPYADIRIYYTEGGEYVGKITGYAPNGLYIKLRQGIYAVATIPIWMKCSPNLNDSVIVRLYEINDKKRKIYCSLLRIIKENK